MKALITGGAGFIGSNLAAYLVGNGHEVTVLDNLSSGYRRNLDPLPQVRLIEGDVRDADAVARAIRGAEAVFHLAASVGNKRSIDFPITDAEINVIGTLRMLEAARQEGVHRIVVSSSAGIFGSVYTLPIREDNPTEPDSPYGATKLCEEKESLAYAKLYGMGIVCLRYFNVFGPNQRFDAYGNVIPIFVFQALRDEVVTVFGDGEQTRDFVHVRDVVQANVKAALAEGVSGAFNIGCGASISVNQLVSLVKKVSGKDFRVVHGPRRPGDVQDCTADVTAARTKLGYNPSVAFEEGLREYYEWAKSEFAITSQGE